MEVAKMEISLKDVGEVKEMFAAFKELFDSINNYNLVEGIPLLEIDNEKSPQHVIRWSDAYFNAKKILYPDEIQPE